MPHPHLRRRLLFSQPYMLLKCERVGWSVRSQEKKDGGRFATTGGLLFGAEHHMVNMVTIMMI